MTPHEHPTCAHHADVLARSHKSPCAWVEAVCWTIVFGVPLLLAVGAVAYRDVTAADADIKRQTALADAGALERTKSIVAIQSSLTYIERDLAEVKSLLKARQQ